MRTTRMIKFTPSGSESREELLTLACLCGERLHPKDARAAWIDDHDGALGQDLIEAYHQGQSRQYEGA